MFPASFEPETQRVQWMDTIPNINHNRPDFFWIMPRGQNTLAELVAKGVTHFTKGDMQQPGWSESQILAFRDSGRGYDDVPKTDVQFFLPDYGPGASKWVAPPGYPVAWPNIWNERFFRPGPGATEPMTVQEGQQKGGMYNNEHTIYVFENGEQDHAISPHWPFCKAWVQAWVPRVLQRWPGRQVLMAWNYISNFGASIKGGAREAKKALLRTPINQWAPNHMLPGGNLDLLNACCYTVYPGPPDDVRHIPYDIIYNAKVTAKAGKHLIVFPQGFHEWLPNVKRKWRIPTGNFYFQTKMSVAPELAFPVALFSKLWAKAFVPFSFGSKDNRPFKLDPEWHNDDVFVPNGNGETETAPRDQSGIYGRPEVFAANGIEDFTGYAMYYYDRVFAETHFGGTEQWLEFRKDGGSWITVTDQEADDVVDAYEDQRGFVVAWHKPGKVSFLVYPGFQDDCQRHLYEWKFNGNVYSSYVAGNMPFGFKTTY